MKTRTALSNYEMYWYPWDDKKRDNWVREMPKYDYVINLENNPITTYKYKMNQENQINYPENPIEFLLEIKKKILAQQIRLLVI